MKSDHSRDDMESDLKEIGQLDMLSSHDMKSNENNIDLEVNDTVEYIINSVEDIYSKSSKNFQPKSESAYVLTNDLVGTDTVDYDINSIEDFNSKSREIIQLGLESDYVLTNIEENDNKMDFVAGDAVEYNINSIEDIKTKSREIIQLASESDYKQNDKDIVRVVKDTVEYIMDSVEEECSVKNKLKFSSYEDESNQFKNDCSEKEDISELDDQTAESNQMDVVLYKEKVGYGLCLKTAPDGLTTFISKVIDNTPAHLCGIQVSDNVIQINNQEVFGLNLSEVKDLMKYYNDKVEMVIERPYNYDQVMNNDVELREVSLTKEKIGYGLRLRTTTDNKHFIISSVVPNSAACRLGIRKMDYVIKINQKSVSGLKMSDIQPLMILHPDHVTLLIKQPDNSITHSIETPMEFPVDTQSKGYTKFEMIKLSPQQSYGFSLKPMKNDDGVFINKVEPQSLAENCGLKEGHVVAEINGFALEGLAFRQITSFVRMCVDKIVLLVCDEVNDLSDEKVNPMEEQMKDLITDNYLEEMHKSYTNFRNCTVENHTSSVGYGFALKSLKNDKGAFISLVKSDSPADLCGLKVNDHVLQVNGLPCENLSYKEIIDVVKTYPHNVNLLLAELKTSSDTNGVHLEVINNSNSCINEDSHSSSSSFNLPDFIFKIENIPVKNFIPDIAERVFLREVKEFYNKGIFDVFEAIRKGILIIAKGYSVEEIKKKTSTDIVDFNLHEVRIAYVLRLFLVHSYAITQHLSNASGESIYRDKYIYKNPEVINSCMNKLKTKTTLKIVCFGGGPGSDVLGVLDFLYKISSHWTIELFMFDKFAHWKDTISKMVAILHENGKKVKFNFTLVDFLVENEIRDVLVHIKEADIVTMCKFVSAIRPYEMETIRGLSIVFYNIPPGALVFFMDCIGGGSHQLYEKVTDMCKLQNLYHMKHDYILPDGPNNYLKKYLSIFGARNTRKITLAVMIHCKPDKTSSYVHCSTRKRKRYDVIR